jgi:hypothetical protein
MILQEQKFQNICMQEGDYVLSPDAYSLARLSVRPPTLHELGVPFKSFLLFSMTWNFGWLVGSHGTNENCLSLPTILHFTYFLN